MKKISLKHVAFGATIVGLSVFAGKKIYQSVRPKIGNKSSLFFDDNQRFSHQYPEAGYKYSEQESSKMQNISDENAFVSEEQSLSSNKGLKRVPDHNFEE